jgi:hypothetical protein
VNGQPVVLVVEDEPSSECPRWTWSRRLVLSQPLRPMRLKQSRFLNRGLIFELFFEYRHAAWHRRNEARRYHPISLAADRDYPCVRILRSGCGFSSAASRILPETVQRGGWVAVMRKFAAGF